jgi:DNA-binding SARP family transcriptional activator
VIRDGDAYELALPAHSFHDVAAFCAALDAARRARIAGDRGAAVESLRAAVAAYGGDLLPEDGPAEWVVRERETFSRRAADAAVELANVELALGDVAGAVFAAQRCVQIDRYCDPGWRLLVSGYTQMGNLAAARRASRDYEDVLTSLEATAPAQFADVPIPARRSPPRQARTDAGNPFRRPT